MLLENKKFILSIGVILFLNLFFWRIILFPPADNLKIYFLDVGQGDSQLVVLPGGVKILIDGGPNASVIEQLDKILPFYQRYIDLVILTHPQKDHSAGLVEILRRRGASLFLSNGQKASITAYQELEKTLKDLRVPTISLSASDKIKYRSNTLSILWPPAKLVSKEINDYALVGLLESPGIKALFTSDIGAEQEKVLIEKYNLDLDILKVAHHGSKFSTSQDFLIKTQPKIAVIEVGKNSYGHPTAEVLNRLVSIGAKILRTDQLGTVKLEVKEGKISISYSN
mgnify:CR=1 FL=1